MSIADTASGSAFLILLCLPLLLASRHVVCAALPQWRGTSAALAYTVTALALLESAAQLVGTFGLFARLPLLLTAWTLAAGAEVAARRLRRPGGADESARVATVRAVPVWVTVVALLVAGLVLVQWAAFTAVVMRNGIVDYDSMQYHLTHAGTFANTGSLTHVEPVSIDPIHTFHPMDTEVLHAIGMLAFGGRSTLSPLLNLVWAAFALFVGWCAGLRARVSPFTLLATAALLATPVMVLTQPGSAASDIAAFGLLAAAVVLFSLERDNPRVLPFTAAALGLAVASKLSVLVPVAFFAGAIAFMWRRRWRPLGRGAVVLLVVGGFWFVRNLVATGNPIPTQRIGIGPLVLPHPTLPIVSVTGFSVADYVGDWGIVRHVFAPQTAVAFGRWWWLLLGGLALAFVAAARDGGRWGRVLVVGGAVALVGYAVTPLTAQGPKDHPEAYLFALNLRHAFPALLLAIPALAVASRLRLSRLAVLSSVAVLIGLLGAELTHNDPPVWPRADGRALESVNDGAAIAKRWVRDIQHARIGVVGVDYMFVLQGETDSNRVIYLERHVPHGGVEPYQDCRAFRDATRAAGIRYVVFDDYGFPRTRDTNAAYRWVDSDSASTLLVQEGATRIYSVDSSLDSSRCPP